ncbi:mevalonate kinase [Bacillus sp. DX1.1]|uniref:mevalonate kinase n=1 Tax=unclassified Bacillus (in: firmicutes) TaxID=185979 RepID=UPI002570094A|nr:MULTISPECIES: mevalonate kinase [unclassified Bacillus (in: firmicutes)]MDM5157259.1 mevalonate kinase [Bacillus sp. DX1.1]WJE81486.1 mevalonate kinase [Bacillus sp. DX3.1]
MITSTPKAAVGYAHSKLILVGEHAVVYGKPAIAIPFPLGVTSTIEEKAGEIMIACGHYVGPINRMPVRMQGIAACIRATLNDLKKPLNGLLIRLHSSIPIGRGLGSSAAIAIAIVKSLFSFYGQKVSQKELMALVEIAEIYAHGNPSGIDMAAASSELPIWFKNGKEIIPLNVGSPLSIVVADSGRIGNTHTAVKKVREKFLLEPEKMQRSLERIERITLEANGALADGNSYLLGRLLNLNHAELITLGVSDDGLNRLVEAARSAGGLGAKLTGSGLGGCVITLAPNLEHAKVIADVLMKAGANKTWYFSTDSRFC